MHDPGKQPHRSHFGRGGKEGGNRCGRTLIDIRRPHMERYSLTLNAKPAITKTRPKSRPRRMPIAAAAMMPERVSCPQSRRPATHRRAASPRTEPQDEILEARLGRFQLITAQRGDHVKRQRLQLKPHVKRHQITSRDHNHHADDTKRHKGILEFHHPCALMIAHAHHQDGGGR